MGCSETDFKDGWKAEDCFKIGMGAESEAWGEAVKSVMGGTRKGQKILLELKSLYGAALNENFEGGDAKNFETCQNPPLTSKRNEREKTSFFGLSRVVDHYVGIRDESKSLVSECMELGKVAGYNIWMKTLSRAVDSGILTDNQKNDIITYRKKYLTMPRLLPASSETDSPAVSPPTDSSPVSSLINRFNKLDMSKRRPGSKVSIPPRGTHRGGDVRLRKNRKSKRRKSKKRKRSDRKSKRSSRKSKTKRRR